MYTCTCMCTRTRWAPWEQDKFSYSLHIPSTYSSARQQQVLTKCFEMENLRVSSHGQVWKATGCRCQIKHNELALVDERGIRGNRSAAGGSRIRNPGSGSRPLQPALATGNSPFWAITWHETPSHMLDKDRAGGRVPGLTSLPAAD